MSQYLGLVHQLVVTKMERGELRIDSFEDLKNVLKEYEIHTKIIEEQLEMCKKDHADLRSEMSRLMNENKDLYERLKMASESAVNRSDRPAVEITELVENLQQQLSLALEEKETLQAMWKSSVQEVDNLKETLNDFQSGKKLILVQSKLNDVQKDYTEAIQILEKKQNSLKAENEQLKMKCKTYEDQLKQVNSQMMSVTEKNQGLRNSLTESTEQEQQWKSKFLAMEAKFIELDRAYQTDKVKYAKVKEYENAESNLRAKLEESQRTGNEMQTALEQCHEHKQELMRQVAGYRTKVEEALILVEEANRDRQEILAREMAATEEAKKLRADWDKLVDEAGRRVASEEANLKKQFDSQLAVVKDQLQVVEQERNRKRTEVEQLQKECGRLQKLATKSQAAGTEQQDKLTRRLSSAESLCEGLRQENQALREELNKLEEKCKRKTQQRQKMESEIHRLLKDTQCYQQELAMSEQKAGILNSQLQATSLDLAQLQSNTILRRGSTVGMEPQVSLTSTLEMCKRLNDSYGQMNDRWKNEMNNFTDKFEEKLKEAKKKNKVSFGKGNK